MAAIGKTIAVMDRSGKVVSTVTYPRLLSIFYY